MNTLTILRKIKSQQVGKLPVVVLPLKDYEKIKEDLEMLYSKKLSGEIKKSREKVRKGKVMNLIDDDGLWENVVDFTKIKKGGVCIEKLLSRL